MSETKSEEKSSITKKISWNLVFSGITVILILIVSMQSLQLEQMKGYMKAREASAAPDVAAKAPVPTAPVQPAATGLRSQVGGC